MKREHRMPRWKRNLIKIPIIVSLSIASFVGVACFASWVDGKSVKYVSYLDGYELRQIGGKPETITKEQYKATKDSIKQEAGNSRICIFPDTIPGESSDFYYFAENVKLRNGRTDRWELYLSCIWSDEQFAFEYDRLRSAEGHKVSPLFSNNLFPYPASVFYFWSATYIYALFDESLKRIYYIAFSEVGHISNIVFDRSLAPAKSLLDSDVASQAPFGKFSCDS